MCMQTLGNSLCLEKPSAVKSIIFQVQNKFLKLVSLHLDINGPFLQGFVHATVLSPCTSCAVYHAASQHRGVKDPHHVLKQVFRAII